MSKTSKFGNAVMTGFTKLFLIMVMVFAMMVIISRLIYTVRVDIVHTVCQKQIHAFVFPYSVVLLWGAVLFICYYIIKKL